MPAPRTNVCRPASDEFEVGQKCVGCEVGVGPAAGGSLPEGVGDCLGAAVDAEFCEHALDVGGDRLRRDEQLACDLALASSLCEQVEHLAFPRCEIVEACVAVPLLAVVPAVAVAAPQQRPDAGEQLVGLERFGAVVVGADQEACDAVERLDARCGEEDERQVVAEAVAQLPDASMFVKSGWGWSPVVGRGSGRADSSRPASS